MGNILRIAAQKADLGGAGVAFQIVVLGKYLARSTKYKCEVGLIANLQAAARFRLSLIAFQFLIPNPPSVFEFEMSFQARRQRLFLESVSLIPVHQKFLITAVSLAMNFFENKILDM